MNETSGAGMAGNIKVQELRMVAPHLFPARIRVTSIRVFSRRYNAYCGEVKTRASQLVQVLAQPIESIRPVGPVFCVCAKQLESAVDLSLIEGSDDLEELDNMALSTVLDKKAIDSSVVETDSDLESMVQENVRIDMFVESANIRMELLFIDFKSLLRQNVVVWITVSNQKVIIRHFLCVIKPVQLRSRFRKHIIFTKHDVKDDFAKFVAHASDLSNALEKLDKGNPCSRPSDSDDRSNKTGSWIRSDSKSASKPSKHSGKYPPRLPCPLDPCKGKKCIHLVDNCERSTVAEKKRSKDMITAARAQDCSF